ncbi:hypothetical protein C2G38_2303420 [Gigaspora rosea]|uniref:Transmembrane protein n=1 Tax=Gigaspora rosea TaxID=44941 RepID=A0A397U0B1_9GLOM|nr:hypothetical protein C2G38_2303420 [Gigaspora rosea]
MCPQITEIGETGPIVHYNQNVNNQSEMPYQNSAQLNFTNQNITSNQETTTNHQNISNCTNDVNINSSSWKLGYIIIFGLAFLVLGIIFLIIKQLSVVSAYEQIDQKEGGWGPNPTNPPCPWVEETNKCKWCSLDKKYCYCDSIIIWNWDDIEYGNYKWCKWCEKTNHNEREYRLMPKSPEIKSQEWKKKIKCSNCSKKYRLVYHDEEEQCPQTYEYSDPRR